MIPSTKLQIYFARLYVILLTAIFCLEQVAPKLSTLTIILFCVVLLFQSWFQKIKLRYSKDVLIFQSIYLFGVVGLLYSMNLKGGLHYLETTASLFIAPFFLSNLILSKKQVGLIILAATVFCCVIHFDLVLQYYQSKGIVWANFFQAENFTLLSHWKLTYFYQENLGHHTFLGQYLCLGIFASIYHLFYGAGKYLKPLLITILTMSLISITISESRIALIVIGIIVLFHLVLYLKPYLSFKKSYFIILFAVGILGGSVLITKKSSHLVSIYENKLAYYRSMTPEEASGNALSRIVIWGNSIETILNQGILRGAGTGDSEHHQIEQYKKNGIPEQYHRFNTHNQYLDYQIRYGLLGLLCFLGSLGYAFGKAFKSKNYLYCGFILIFMTFCLTENMLQRQAGVVFFAFFNALLYFSGKPSASSAPPT